MVGLPSEPSGGRAPRPYRNLTLLAGLLAALTLGSLALGPVSVPLSNIPYLLAYRMGITPHPYCPAQLVIDGYSDPCWIQAAIFSQLLAITLLALLVGAALALAGATMQGLFRNPLADPYLLGISSGAALGAAVAFVGVTFVALAPLQADEEVFLPFLAFLGALGTGLVVLLASRSRWATTETLILTGVALGAILGDLMVLLVSLRPQSLALPLTFWLLGGFGAATWDQVGILALAVVVAGTVLTLHGRVLNVLQMGEETALGLGVPVASMRRRLILTAVLLTGVAVAFSGVIGFVGLISPHMVRRLQGPNYRTLVPASALVGAILMVAANDVATTVLGGGATLPAGVVTGVMGGPFILYLLYHRRKYAGVTA